MNPFGGLFGHDKISARASGAYTDPSPVQHFQLGGYGGGELPPLGEAPQPAPQAQPQQPVAAQLPPAPPVPQRKAGAFDDDHYRQTMLAMAAGFFGSQNLGDGLSHAAEAIYNGNADAQRRSMLTHGGPDDAFVISTDPRTGQQTYTLDPAVADYHKQKLIDAAAAKRPGPSAKDNLDAIGRLAGVASGYDMPEDRQAAWTAGRASLGQLGYDVSSIPDAYSPGWLAFGGTVPQMQGAAEKARHNGITEAETVRHHGVTEAQGGANLAERTRHNGVTEGQGAARVSLGQAKFNAANHVRVTSEAQYNSLRKGTVFIAPDGTTRTKQ